MADNPCPRGAAYDRPWFGFGSCDDGYVASAGMIIQGYGNQCVCAESPKGEEIIGTGDAIFGIDYDKILIAMTVIVVIIILVMIFMYAPKGRK